MQEIIDEVRSDDKDSRRRRWLGQAETGDVDAATGAEEMHEGDVKAEELVRSGRVVFNWLPVRPLGS